MAMIKIIRGTFGLRVGNVTVGKTPTDEPFEVDEKTADRLVKDRVAEKVGKDTPSGVMNPPPPAPPKEVDPLAYDSKMNMTQLSAVALKHGVTQAELNVCRTKQSIIDLIEAAKKKFAEALAKAAEDKGKVDEDEDEDSGEGEGSGGAPDLGNGADGVTQ